MNTKRILIFFLMMIATGSLMAQKAATLSAKELKNFIGCWEGSLNYSSTLVGKPYSANATMAVKQIGRTSQFEIVTTYPGEPNEVSSDTFSISADGKKFNGAVIKSKKVLANGNLEIVTETTGLDNVYNKKAVTTETYIIGKSIYNYKKEVMPAGLEKKLRQENKFVRKAC